ncbi:MULTISPECIES: hypothetical protein [Pseudomonas]|uniref:Uncharacterized protein n=3 Tax=Pseudomonas TaxID=286 RepID=A0ABX7G960_9PSED|nr:MULTISPECIES: hypothetical protein [Pseudomonas]QRK81878.1 hypothetical protein JN757_14965 [Pseudomonas granadensis]TKK29068.1 hypothetical protein PspCFBP13528_18880 [Pseudomonas sp. CFBP13528]
MIFSNLLQPGSKVVREIKMTHVTLSLDFENANAVRKKAYKFLAEEEWVKLDSVDTVWVIDYPEYNYNYSDDVRKIHYNIAKTLKQCAKDLDIERINYIVQVGDRLAIQRQVTYKYGVAEEKGYAK